MELIRHENLTLYNDIRKNYEYYVSEDYAAIYGYLKDSSKEYNEKATQYFDKLFEKDKNVEYKDILCLLFPNVEKYDKAYRAYRNTVEFLNESGYIIEKDKEKYKQSLIERRIYNAKFFDLYFIKQENDFIKIDTKIKEFIRWNNSNYIDINNGKDLELMQSKLSEILFMYKGIGQKFVIETLELYCKDIEENKVLILTKLIASQKYMDNTPIFLGLNANDRLEIVCAEIMKSLSENELEKIKSIIEDNYTNMYFIGGVIHWLKKENNSFNQNYNEKLYNELNESYKKLISNVTTKNINMYSDKNYSRYNIYSFIDSEESKNQMKYINKNNIFAFLADMISGSVGTGGYGYSINLDTFNKLSSFEIVDTILSNIEDKDLDEIEIFIKEVYNKSKDIKQESSLHEKAIYSNKFIDLRNIEIKEGEE